MIAREVHHGWGYYYKVDPISEEILFLEKSFSGEGLYPTAMTTPAREDVPTVNGVAV